MKTVVSDQFEPNHDPRKRATSSGHPIRPSSLL
jgi:hypothetical protein